MKTVFYKEEGGYILSKIMFKMKNCQKKPLDEIQKGLNLKDIKFVWTVYDAEKMWSSCKFNPYTGKAVTTLDDIVLTHNEGVFIEDRMHDWNVNKGVFHYYSRVVEKDREVDLIFELQ